MATRRKSGVGAVVYIDINSDELDWSRLRSLLMLLLNKLRSPYPRLASPNFVLCPAGHDQGSLGGKTNDNDVLQHFINVLGRYPEQRSH